MARGTRPRRQRDPLERDNTPQWAADLATRALADIGVNPDTVWEPCAGGGSLLRAAWRRWPDATVWGSDIDPDAVARLKAEGHHAFVRDLGTLEPGQVTSDGNDLILTNFPFSRAEEFVRRLRGSSSVLAAILPLSFLASTRRFDFWMEFPVDRLMVFSRRIPFESPDPAECRAFPLPAEAVRNGTSTASQDLALFVWGVRPGPLAWLMPED